MTKDFNEIEIGDKIYFMPTDSKDNTCQEIEVVEIVDNVHRLHYNFRHSFGETYTKYIGNNAIDIEVKNEYERCEGEGGSISMKEVSPRKPVSSASLRDGDKVVFGFAATRRELIGLCGEVFGCGYELAQRDIKTKYLAFTDAMGIERPYRPPQRLM